MRKQSDKLVWIAMTVAVVLVLVPGGCGTDLGAFFAPFQDEDGGVFINVTFINETDFRVVTDVGTYNPLDPDGESDNFLISPPNVQELVVESGQQSTVTQLQCARSFDIAGPALRRAVVLGKPEGVDPLDIEDEIGFSDLPLTDDDPTLPTVGTTEAVRYRLGFDFSCGDTIEITFKEEDGEFVVEFEVIITEV